MLLAQIRRAVWSGDFTTADRELRRNIRRDGAARHQPDMELDDLLVGPIGHRVVAGRQAGEFDARVLARGEIERATGLDLQAHHADVVRCVGDADHLAGEAARRTRRPRRLRGT